MRNLLSRFAGDRSGAFYLEFALIAPLLLTLFAGTVELTNALLANRKMVGVAQATADLVTQETEIFDGDMDDIFAAAGLITQPFPTDTLTIGVVSVRFDLDTGDPVVDWQESFGGGSVSDPLGRAIGLGRPGESVIIVTVTYTYTPTLADLITGPVDMSDTAFSRPRRSLFVTRS